RRRRSDGSRFLLASGLGDRARAVADEQARLEADVVPGGFAVHQRPQPAPRLAAQLVPGNGRGGQRRGGVSGEGDVVEAGDGDVARHGYAQLVQAAEGSEGHHVVVGDYGGRTGVERGSGDGVAVLEHRAAGQLGELEAVGRGGGTQRGHAVLVGGARVGTGEVDQVAVAVSEQVGHDLPDAGGVVHRQGGHV